MDNSFDQQEAKAQSKTIFLAYLLKIIYNIADWMESLLLLTEKEKKKAGIYIGRMGEDD